MIVIGNHETRYEVAGVTVYRLRNQVAWQPGRETGYIQAVGAPESWGTAEPLPAGTVVADLVDAAVAQPQDAAKLWGAFLAYVATAANMSGWRRVFTALRMVFWRTPVRLEIAERSRRVAVITAIRKAPSFRFRIVGPAD